MNADRVAAAVIEAVRAARGTVSEIAEEAGYSRTMLDKYLNRRRPTSRRAALAVADALEARARRILDHAEHIREACHDSGDAAPEPGRGDPRDG